MKVIWPITKALNYKGTFGETQISIHVDLKNLKGLTNAYILNIDFKKDSNIISIVANARCAIFRVVIND